jgi:hypothetical protein
MADKSEQLIKPADSFRFDRKYSCVQYLEQMEQIHNKNVVLDLDDRIIDYPVTYLLTSHILKELSKLEGVKKLTIITRITLPEDHLLNLLFKEKEPSCLLSVEKTKAKIKVFGVKVCVRMVEYDYKKEMILNKTEWNYE